MDEDQIHNTPSAEMERLYETLRAIAHNQMRRERAGHTLEATAVVHEAYMRLSELDGGAWADQDHFLSIAAASIRRVLVDHARGRNSLKRGGDAGRLTLHSGIADTPTDSAIDRIDILALDEALTKLAAQDEESARLVELRYFGGMTIDQAADHLSIGRNTAARRWRAARAWLKREIGDGTNAPDDDLEQGIGED
ncbi:MAG: sigma-70 family RNA polymerase sigma factor [Phycisphaerales bacterium]|nr:sigma-70 family RNA polymerase sigma factor [Phycisphaerales bacterium]